MLRVHVWNEPRFSPLKSVPCVCSGGIKMTQEDIAFYVDNDCSTGEHALVRVGFHDILVEYTNYIAAGEDLRTFTWPSLRSPGRGGMGFLCRCMSLRTPGTLHRAAVDTIGHGSFMRISSILAVNLRAYGHWSSASSNHPPRPIRPRRH